MMFERLTDRGCQVLALAILEAQRLKHGHLGAEHVLLGLLKEGSGVGAAVIKNAGLDLGDVQRDLERLVAPVQAAGGGERPPRRTAMEVIEAAVDEARHLGHRYVGTEHVLLGLLRGHDDAAARVLVGLGLALEKARAEVVRFLVSSGRSEAPAGGGQAARRSSMCANFTDRARKAIALANEEALRLQHAYLGPDHIFLGMLREGGIAIGVLVNLGVDIRSARRRIEQGLPEEPDLSGPGKLPHSPGAKAALAGAIEESGRLGHRHVGTEHLLLGLLHNSDSLTSRILGEQGVDLAKARMEVARLLGDEGKPDQPR